MNGAAPTIELEIDQDITSVTTQTLDLLYSEDSSADATVLYFFYVKTAKWQRNASIKAVELYCRKCLNWGHDRMRAARKILLSLNLIEDIVRKDKKGKVEGYYVKVKFVWFKRQPARNPVESPVVGLGHYWMGSTSGFGPLAANRTQIPDVTENNIPDGTLYTTYKVEPTAQRSQAPTQNNNINDEQQGQAPTSPSNASPSNKPHSKPIPNLEDVSNHATELKNKDETEKKPKKKYGKAEVNELHEYFLKQMEIKAEDCSEGIYRRYWNLLLKESETGVIGVKALIDLVVRDEWDSKHVTSSQKIYYNRAKISLRAKTSKTEEKLGYTEGEFLTTMFKQMAERHGTTPEIESAKYEAEVSKLKKTI